MSQMSSSTQADLVHSQAPGPRGSFLVGSVFDFQRDPLSFIMKSGHQYGDGTAYKLAYIQMGQVNHPVGIQRILLETNHNYIKCDYWDAIHQIDSNRKVEILPLVTLHPKDGLWLTLERR